MTEVIYHAEPCFVGKTGGLTIRGLEDYPRTSSVCWFVVFLQLFAPIPDLWLGIVSYWKQCVHSILAAFSFARILVKSVSYLTPCLTLMLCSFCRSDQLDQAQSSNRVLVWLYQYEWSGVVGKVEYFRHVKIRLAIELPSGRKAFEEPSCIGRIQDRVGREAFVKWLSCVGLKCFTRSVP